MDITLIVLISSKQNIEDDEIEFIYLSLQKFTLSNL